LKKRVLKYKVLTSGQALIPYITALGFNPKAVRVIKPNLPACQSEEKVELKHNF